MTRVRQLLAVLCLSLVVMLLLSCSPASDLPTYWVDGTRGCREEPHAVGLWSAPGAANVDAEVVGAVPHHTQFRPSEIKSAFGLRYYRVTWDGQAGWLPGNYVKTVEPICE